MTVIPFPLPDPSPSVAALLWPDLLPAQHIQPRLRVAPDELEPEWDSGDSNDWQDRVEAGLEPEWPDD